MALKKGHHHSLHQHSLVVIIVDASPMAWGKRHQLRQSQDAARAAVQKTTVGPCRLDECLESVTVLASAIHSSERQAVVIVMGVADNECQVLYPRQAVSDLDAFLKDPEHCALSAASLRKDVILGIAEITARAAKTADTSPSNATSRQAAMTSALSQALCLINRCLVASRSKNAISAVEADHSILNRAEDDGVLGILSGASNATGANKHKHRSTVQSVWAPRVLLMQASDDRSRDYNAFMNCAFAASKQNVVVDGCFLQAADKNASSGFLEQAADLTGGVFSAPTMAAQVHGGLTEVLLSVFLPPVPCRTALHLPALTKVDFRARCFETAETVDMAYVCNQCLSIFKNKPQSNCPTCQANIYGAHKKAKGSL